MTFINAKKYVKSEVCDRRHIATTRMLTRVIVILSECGMSTRRDIFEKINCDLDKLNDALNWLISNHLITHDARYYRLNPIWVNIRNGVKYG